MADAQRPTIRTRHARLGSPHATLARRNPAASPQLPHAADLALPGAGGPPLPPARTVASCGVLRPSSTWRCLRGRHCLKCPVECTPLTGIAARRDPVPMAAAARRSARLCRRCCCALSAPSSSLQTLATPCSQRTRFHVLAPFGEFHWHLLLTLPRPDLKVDAKAVTDGDTITVYVDTADHPESCNVPREILRVAVERAKARAAKNYDRADELQKIILDAGYRQVPNLRGEQVLAKKYRIRLRGIDAPENTMPYGKEAKEELVKLVQGKSLKISIYDNDRYGRLVGDVDCNGIFVQERMLKKGLAWHYTAYDQRVELAKWQNQAQASRMGLWALPNPEKPWEWRKGKRIRTV